jgi:hypothetical protein
MQTAKEDQEDEQVIDAELAFDQIAGHELQSGLFA